MKIIINMANYNIENRKNKINNWILSVKSDLYNNVNKIMELNKLSQWESFLNNFYAQNKPVIIHIHQINICI